jgi:hypothetical protein
MNYLLVQSLSVGCSPEPVQPYTVPKTGLLGKHLYSRHFANVNNNNNNNIY